MDREHSKLSVEQSNLEEARKLDSYLEGRDKYEMDIDRMVNEGLGAGYVTEHNGLVDDESLETS